MSKKYKEELDKIVMNEDMKKRILNNVLNKNIEAKSTIPRVKKYSNLKRNMQLTAACTIGIVCLSVAKSYPELLKYDNSNFEQNQIINNRDDENQILKNSEESELNDDNNTDGNNNEDVVEKHDIINSHISSDISNNDSVKNESNDKLYNNENSLEIEEKEKISDDSAANSSVSAKTSSESQTNTKAEAENLTGLDNNLNDVLKSQDQTNNNENKENNDLENSTMVSYGDFIKEYKTLEEAEDAVKLKINPIKALPKGFNMNNISVMSNEIIQIEYINGQDNITFRAGKDIENISGDFNEYEIKNTRKVNGININLEGNKNKLFNLATWEKDGISYSISSTNGIDEEVILNMIK